MYQSITDAVSSTRPEHHFINEMERRAHEWMACHPKVMQLYERMATQLAFRGQRFGIGHLTEIVRWEYGRMHPEHSGIRICNSHRAYIARELIRRDPYLANYIELRPIRCSA